MFWKKDWKARILLKPPAVSTLSGFSLYLSVYVSYPCLPSFQEYQEDKNDLVISETELKQVAYIFKCEKSTLQIKGKINSITVGRQN